MNNYFSIMLYKQSRGQKEGVTKPTYTINSPFNTPKYQHLQGYTLKVQDIKIHVHMSFCINPTGCFQRRSEIYTSNQNHLY